MNLQNNIIFKYLHSLSVPLCIFKAFPQFPFFPISTPLADFQESWNKSHGMTPFALFQFRYILSGVLSVFCVNVIALNLHWKMIPAFGGFWKYYWLIIATDSQLLGGHTRVQPQLCQTYVLNHERIREIVTHMKSTNHDGRLDIHL